MKYIKIFFILIYIFLFIPTVNAAECTNAEKVELGKKAALVKVGYEEQTGIRDSSEVVPPDGYDPDEYILEYNYFDINFYNLTEDIYIKLENKDADKEIIITYEDTDDGNYSLEWYDINKVNNFTYSIIANFKTNCYEKVLKEGVITLPAYNPYYTHGYCKGHESYSLCQKYINTSITYNEFEKRMQKYLKSLEDKEEQNKKENEGRNSILQFFKNNKDIILISIGIIVFVGGFIIGLVIRKRKERAI